MATYQLQAPSDLSLAISKLQDEIERQQNAVDGLRVRGQPCSESERRLHHLKEVLALLR